MLSVWEDLLVSRAVKREAKIKERDVWVEGEFLSEEDMVEAKIRPVLGLHVCYNVISSTPHFPKRNNNIPVSLIYIVYTLRTLQML